VWWPTVWLLLQCVKGDPAGSMFAMGVFSDPVRAKLAVSEDTGQDQMALDWSELSWDASGPAYKTEVAWLTAAEKIPLEYWIVPFALDQLDSGTLKLEHPWRRPAGTSAPPC